MATTFVLQANEVIKVTSDSQLAPDYMVYERNCFKRIHGDPWHHEDFGIICPRSTDSWRDSSNLDVTAPDWLNLAHSFTRQSLRDLPHDGNQTCKSIILGKQHAPGNVLVFYWWSDVNFLDVKQMFTSRKMFILRMIMKMQQLCKSWSFEKMSHNFVNESLVKRWHWFFYFLCIWYQHKFSA